MAVMHVFVADSIMLVSVACGNADVEQGQVANSQRRRLELQYAPHFIPHTPTSRYGRYGVGRLPRPESPAIEVELLNGCLSLLRTQHVPDARTLPSSD
jgi:hypothetical protein